jgi:hypothetical protein
MKTSNTTPTRRRCFSIFAALAFTSIVSVNVNAQIAELVAPDVKVAGRSQNEWGDRWWQWAFSFDSADSPVADRTGENCQLKQEGDVWFLAGTYGSARTIRKCTVPAGKHLFFPLVNYIYYPRSLDSKPKCDALKRKAAELTEDVSLLVLELNGKRASGLEKHRFSSDACFNLGVRRVPVRDMSPAAANGYFVMLKPLPPGKYDLNFGGQVSSNAQAVTYRLEVK